MPSETTANPPEVQFAGPPHKIRPLTPLPVITGAADEPNLELDSALTQVMPESAQPVRLISSSGTVGQRLRIKLDRRTPPGVYRATLRIGPSTIPAQIQIEPATRLHVSPSEIVFDGPLKGTAEWRLILENRGNVAVDVPENNGVGIFDDDGFETAFASTYQQETDDLGQLAKHFVGKLREAHGGLLRFRIVQGAGVLNPGEARQIVLQAALLASLRAGRSYHGVWTLETLNCAVRVVVREAPPEVKNEPM